MRNNHNRCNNYGECKLPKYADLDILKIIFSEKKIRPKDITKRICEIVKRKSGLELDVDHVNRIRTKISRKLDKFTEDNIIEREYESAKKVWYIATRKTQSEIFRLTLQHAKHYIFGYSGFSTFEGKATFFFEPQDPEVVSKIHELMKKDDEETDLFVKFLTALMRFVVQGLVFSKEGKYTNIADFYKDNVYFIGKFPKETSLLMKQVVEKGILTNYTQILREGISPMEDFWKAFGQGKGGITIPSGELFEYDIDTQKIVERKSKKKNFKAFDKRGCFSTGKIG